MQQAILGQMLLPDFTMLTFDVHGLSSTAERDNQNPIAIAKPSYQEITQPNDLIIDGSGLPIF